ncbi:MAG: hypothetical protein QGG53_28985 [Planctomycetota bacterium]|jgi:hypothetical protein|nr:hypothetical protein [Planctomycetota bacterium]
MEQLLLRLTIPAIITCIAQPLLAQASFEIRQIQAGGKTLFYKGKQIQVGARTLVTKDGVAWADVMGRSAECGLRIRLRSSAARVLSNVREKNPKAEVVAMFQGLPLGLPVPVPSGSSLYLPGPFQKSQARTYAARLVPSIDGRIRGLLATDNYPRVFFVQLRNAPTLPYPNTVFYLNNELSEKYAPLATFDAASDHVDRSFDASNFAISTKPGLLFIEADVAAVPSRLQGDESPTNHLRFLIEDMEITGALSKSKSWIKKYAQAEAQLDSLKKLVHSLPGARRREAIVSRAGAIGKAVEGLKVSSPTSQHVAALREVEKFSYAPKRDWFDGRDIAVRAHALLDGVGLTTAFRFGFKLPRINYTTAFHRHTSLNSFLREVNTVVGAYESNSGVVELTARTVTLHDIRGTWKEQDFVAAKRADATARSLKAKKEAAAALKTNAAAAKHLSEQGISARALSNEECWKHFLTRGVAIESVSAEGKAAASGLQAGDIVMQVRKSDAPEDTDRIPSAAVQLGEALQAKQQLQQTEATLSVLRGGKTMPIKLAIPQAAGWSVSKTLQNLAVIVTTDKKKYMMGEPIIFTIRFFNKSEEDFELAGEQLNRNIGVAFQRKSTEFFPLREITGDTKEIKVPAGKQIRFKYVCFARVVPGATRVSLQVPFANFYDEENLGKDAVNSRPLAITIDRKPWVRGRSDWRTLKYAALVHALGNSDKEIVAAAEDRIGHLGAEAGRAITRLKSDRSLSKNASKALKLIGKKR